MSKEFDKCVAEGGYIKTIQKTKGRYYRTCALKGKVSKSAVKKKKTDS